MPFFLASLWPLHSYTQAQTGCATNVRIQRWNTVWSEIQLSLWSSVSQVTKRRETLSSWSCSIMGFIQTFIREEGVWLLFYDMNRAGRGKPFIRCDLQSFKASHMHRLFWVALRPALRMLITTSYLLCSHMGKHVCILIPNFNCVP